jgi:ubiquinone/menaquinone biosynthesis C-methylase UbiE
MDLLELSHGKYIHNRRVKVLANLLSNYFPLNSTILDVGCGDGLLASLILTKRPDLNITGVDILKRPKTHINVVPFNGQSLPFEDRTFDFVMFVDVLHHTNNQKTLLREAKRVASNGLIIDRSTLCVMDWVGNARHGVNLEYDYWTNAKWATTFENLGLKTEHWITDLQIYPKPLDLIFGRSLHFIAHLSN